MGPVFLVWQFKFKNLSFFQLRTRLWYITKLVTLNSLVSKLSLQKDGLMENSDKKSDAGACQYVCNCTSWPQCILNLKSISKTSFSFGYQFLVKFPPVETSEWYFSCWPSSSDSDFFSCWEIFSLNQPKASPKTEKIKTWKGQLSLNETKPTSL